MPAFKVRAKQPGEYNGVFYDAGREFFLVDRKDPDTGEILQTAEEAFANVRDRKNSKFGWMERVGAPVATETPEQRERREANEAQRKADMALMMGKGLNPDDPSLMLNAAGTAQLPKITGGMGYDGEGSHAGENDGSGITLTALMDAGHTEAEAKALLKEHAQQGQPSLAPPQAVAPRAAAPAGGPRKASGAARAAVGAPPAPAAVPAAAPAAPAAAPAAPQGQPGEGSQSATDVI